MSDTIQIDTWIIHLPMPGYTAWWDVEYDRHIDSVLLLMDQTAAQIRLHLQDLAWRHLTTGVAETRLEAALCRTKQSFAAYILRVKGSATKAAP